MFTFWSHCEKRVKCNYSIDLGYRHVEAIRNDLLNFCRKISKMFLACMKNIYKFLGSLLKVAHTPFIKSTSSFLNSIFI